ncbi:MAG: hypothetical protein RR571_05635 [Anaerorhabdus sp.]
MPARFDIIGWLFIGIFILKLKEDTVMKMSQDEICILLEKYHFAKLCGLPINEITKGKKDNKFSIDDVIPV